MIKFMVISRDGNEERKDLVPMDKFPQDFLKSFCHNGVIDILKRLEKVLKNKNDILLEYNSRIFREVRIYAGSLLLGYVWYSNDAESYNIKHLKIRTESLIGIIKNMERK